MATYRYMRQVEIRSAALGLSGVTVASANTGTAFDASGANCLTVFYEFTRVAGTGNLSFTVEAQNPETSTWIQLQAVETSSGTSTFTNNSLVEATGSGSIAGEFRLRNLNFRNMRIKVGAVTNASTDTLTVTAILGCGVG